MEVLRREFGNNTEEALEKCVWSPAPAREGEPESKPSPSFPAQVQPLGPWDVPSCPGNVLPGHAASISLCLPDFASLAPLAQPAPWGCTASHWGPGESQKDHYQRARPSSHPGFGGAQLPAAAAAVNSESGWDAPVKHPRRGAISLCQGQLWTCFPAAPRKVCQRQTS